jgi:hypothetical protein
VVERALSAFFLLFSLAYLAAATGLTFGSPGSPKSGFLPILVGTGGSLLALLNLLGVLRRPAGAAAPPVALARLGAFSAVLGAYLVLLKVAGFTWATFAALTLLMKVTGTSGWLTPLAVAGGVAVGAYLTFGYLGVVFP